MRIVSNFDDYYDSCQYACGEDVYYNRERTDNLIDLKKYLYSQWYNKISVGYNLLQIGNILMPYIRVGSENYFNKEDAIKEHFRMQEDYYKEHFPKNYKKYERLYTKNLSEEPKIIEHFTKDFSDLVNYARNNRRIADNVKKTPIIVYSVDEIVLNPCLKSLGVSKLVDSNIVIQEIEMFLNNYNCIEKQVNFDNKTKITQNGFDLKTSFRK